jgi:hypothetical protein
MRIDELLHRGSLRALLLTVLGAAACNEADGTDPWPGAYPPEAQIDRPKGGAPDAGRDAASADDAALDAGTDPDAAPNGDAAPASDAASASDASADMG